MDHLSQEILDQICASLEQTDIISICNVSTRFRKSVQRNTKIRSLFCVFDYIKENKQIFLKTYSGFLYRLLRQVRIQTVLPGVPKGYGCRESKEKQPRNHELFSEQIHEVFATLKLVEDRAGPVNLGDYELYIVSPVEPKNISECFHRHHAQWRTCLLDHGDIPKVSSVRGIHIVNDGSNEGGCHVGRSRHKAKLDYRIIFDLVAKCPNVERLECHFGVDELTSSYREEPAIWYKTDYDGPRRDTRHEYGDAITTLDIPKTLRIANLDFLSTDSVIHSSNQWAAMPNLVLPAYKDPFSASLRILSYHLRELHIRAQVDEALFWPDDNSSPTWPHLARCVVMFYSVSPSGAWFFEGPRGEGRLSTGYQLTESAYPPLETTSDDEGEDCEVDDVGYRSFSEYWDYAFRISPNEAVMSPFLTNFAKAACRMPQLRDAVIWTPIRWKVKDEDEQEGKNDAFDYFELPEAEKEGPDLTWGFIYSRCDPDVRNFGPGKPTRALIWTVRDWRPDPILHDLFQQIGENHGGVLKEEWESELYGRGDFDHNLFPMDRWMFTE